MLCFTDTEQCRLMPPLPESVVYQQFLKLPHGGLCYSINTERLSNIVAFGCSKEILIYDSNLHFESHMTCNDSVRSVGYHTKSRKIYYLDSSWRVGYVTLNGFQSGKKVLDFKTCNDYPRIAVSDEYLVVSNVGGYKLHVYSFSSMTSRRYFCGSDRNWIRSLKFDVDSLITLDVTGLVSKYKISETKSPEFLWSCPTARGAYALCVDKNTGVVYVTGPDHMLYIIYGGMLSFRKTIKSFWL